MSKKLLSKILQTLGLMLAMVQISQAREYEICDTTKILKCPSADKVVSGFNDPNWYVYRGYIGPIAPVWFLVHPYLRSELPFPVCVYETKNLGDLLLVSKASFCKAVSGDWSSGACKDGNDICSFNPPFGSRSSLATCKIPFDFYLKLTRPKSKFK